jgi:hypothetical protein
VLYVTYSTVCHCDCVKGRNLGEINSILILIRCFAFGRSSDDYGADHFMAAALFISMLPLACLTIVHKAWLRTPVPVVDYDDYGEGDQGSPNRPHTGSHEQKNRPVNQGIQNCRHGLGLRTGPVRVPGRTGSTGTAQRFR